MSVDKEGQDTKKRAVGIYIISFIVIVGTILGVVISYFSSIIPAKQKESASLPRGDAPNAPQIENSLVSTSSRQKESAPSSLHYSSLASSQDSSRQLQDIEQLSLQEQVKKLKEMLKEREMTIAELSEKVSKMGMPTIKEGLKKLPKMVPLVVGECVTYGVGRWEMPKTCADTIAKKSRELLKKEPDILVWEIVPRVDTIAYKGLSPELKQHGLGAFRVDSLKKVLRFELGENTVIFQSAILQEPDKRGFMLKAYKLEYQTF